MSRTLGGPTTEGAQTRRTSRRVELGSGFGMFVALLVLAACSPTQPEPTESAPGASSFREQLYWAQRDETVTVSDAQIQALERAVETGEMSYEEISALLEDTIRCFEAAGISCQREADWENPPGFRVPNLTYGEPLDVADACWNETSQYAHLAYQAQPRATELRDAALEAERDAVIECLRAHGSVIDDDATLDEIRQANAALWRDAAGTDAPSVFCSENI